MSDDKFLITDQDGDTLRIIPDAGHIRLAVGDTDGDEYLVDIPIGEVREVTDAMHAQAGLPDRWADLKAYLDANAADREYERYEQGDRAYTALRVRAETFALVRQFMDETEATGD